jgi:hypothetical protein
MPVPLIYAAYLGAAALITAYTVDKVGEGARDAGEGIEKTSNGALKLAVVAGVGYVIAKKQGWL